MSLKGSHLYFALLYVLCVAIFCLSNASDEPSLCNVARSKPTAQGPGDYITFHDNGTTTVYPSHLAADGIEVTDVFSCTHSITATPMWWMVDLQAPYHIDSVALLNRDMFNFRLQNFTVDIFSRDPRGMPDFPGNLGKIITYHRGEVGTSQWVTFKSDDFGSLTGRFVRVIKWGYGPLTLCEVRGIKRYGEL